MVWERSKVRFLASAPLIYNMQLKLHIEQLQALYDSWSDEDKAVFGEPEIMVDCFELNAYSEHAFYYAGLSPEIKIEKSSDGCYDIVNLFGSGTWKPKTSPVLKSLDDSLSTNLDITSK